MAHDLCGEVLDETVAAIHRFLRDVRRKEARVSRLLDVGCWDGARTLGYAQDLDLEPQCVYGVDCFEHVVAQAAEHFAADTVDIERQALPYSDGFFDVVVCNQVFEHLKGIAHPMSEIHRVLRPGGWLLFSVPNLASLHNRLLLMAGRQPTAVRVMGPHVRGFTHHATREFLQWGNLFRIEAQAGIGFYPLPIILARPFARALVSLSHTVVYLLQRGGQQHAPTWQDAMSEVEHQTNF